MPIIAMEVKTVSAHPNADKLQVYTMEAPGHDARQIVANMTNIYQTGDVVAVATIGTVLEDGMEIKQATIRGQDSFGMALGTIDVPAGQDVTREYNAK